MKHEETGVIDVFAIELEARKLRADHTAAMLASARAWIAAKFAFPAGVASKTA